MSDEYPDLLCWVDLETTGLDRRTCDILEIGFLVTDARLNRLDSRSWVVRQPPRVLGGMGEWCLRQHGRSGLIADSAVLGVELPVVREEAFSYLALWIPDGRVPMCGASVHFDREILARLIPRVEGWFYYGNVDVSGIGRLAKLWYPELPAWPDTDVHRVDPDNLDAVAELAYYREHLFRAMKLQTPLDLEVQLQIPQEVPIS